jgi:hypothetical protein
VQGDGYSVVLPAGWKPLSVPGGVTAYADSPARPYPAMLAVSATPIRREAGIDSVKFHDQMTTGLFDKLEERRETKIGQDSAVRYQGDFSKEKHVRYAVYHGDRQVSFEFKCHQDDAAHYLPVFDQIANSITFSN